MKSVARFLLFLFFVLVALSGFIFTIRNSAPIGFWLGIGFEPKPVGVWVLLAFTTGGLLGLLLGIGLLSRLRNRMQIMQLRSRLHQAEQELAALKHAQALAPRQGNGHG
jgi:uncharacterized integral membrane protein